MLNICFHESEAGMLKVALRGEKVSYSYTSLDLGRISLTDFDISRKYWIDALYAICSEQERAQIFEEEKNRFQEIIMAAKQGETLRIWTASAPFSKCGYYHLVYNLRGVDCKILVVEMPKNIGSRSGRLDKAWWDATPDQMSKHKNRQKELSVDERSAIVQEWTKLMESNADLRLNINDKLTNVTVDFFDDEIMSNVPNGEFRVAKLVGLTLGGCIHTITSYFVADRIRVLIEKGKLKIVQYAEQQGDFFRAILQKVN